MELTEKIKKYFWMQTLLVGTLLFISSMGMAYAGGQPTDGGVVASFCYDPSTTALTILNSQDGRKACQASGLTIVEPGKPVPVPACAGGTKPRGISEQYTRSTCTQNGGTVVEAGQALPAFTATNDDSAKNRQDNNNSPEATTSSERDAIRDCNEGAEACLRKNPIMKWTLFAINFLSAGVGVIVAIMIVVGGIQYASAGGNPQAVQAAKSRIANAVLALVSYFFLFAFMQWLVPGGLF